MAMVVGVALAAAAGSTTSKRPLASHVAGGSAAPPYVTVTAAPGASRPQSATGLPPCSTMDDAKCVGSVMARAASGASVTRTATSAAELARVAMAEELG